LNNITIDYDGYMCAIKSSNIKKNSYMSLSRGAENLANIKAIRAELNNHFIKAHF